MKNKQYLQIHADKTNNKGLAKAAGSAARQLIVF
jgi:hypothetical protein